MSSNFRTKHIAGPGILYDKHDPTEPLHKGKPKVLFRYRDLPAEGTISEVKVYDGKTGELERIDYHIYEPPKTKHYDDIGRWYYISSSYPPSPPQAT